MNLSDHFTLEEFIASDTATALKISNMPPPGHMDNLKRTAKLMERVRAALGGKPIIVTSGYRGVALNKAVGGVPTSDHCLGYACDFQCPAFGTPYEVALHLSKVLGEFDQLIHERKPSGSWWVHVSSNPRQRKQLLTFNGKGYVSGIKQVKF